MKTLIIRYIQEGSKQFYRISSPGGEVRDVAMTSLDRDYRALYSQLKLFSSGEEVGLEFNKDFPYDKQNALEELVVIHNATIEK